MRNIALLILILSTGGIMMKLLLVSPVDAAVTGPCPKCHTMHNSQNDSAERLSGTKDGDFNYAGTGSTSPECIICHNPVLVSLLKTDCLGCHAQAPENGSELIVDATPQIAHNAGKGLAAGNYWYLFAGTGIKGHDVHGLRVGQDPKLLNTPPGYRDDSNPSVLTYNDTFYHQTINQIMCAGSQGCHGNRDLFSATDAMAGTHHEDDSVLKLGSGFNESLQGTTVGRSYRFLYKIKGIEDPDWQFTSANDDHNEYLGTTYSGVAGASQVNDSIQTWNNISTISQFCGECHGMFHARYNTSGNDGIGAENAWLRHPSDVVIPNSGEYTKYTNYDVNVPVGRQLADLQTIGAGSKARATVTPGTDIVICLSCHQAHASQFTDILRWSYSAITSATAIPNGTACFACHSEKD